ncbi:MAG: hypothetical protein BZ137_08835 [Methanosphaera sp. rholeuAM130]|nr:hypothetical protein [Methanosphaera sp.]RAP52289.1 MAG: hypothetical protein BZ137_08835 [Methanosphaera sp. rholeuAM130]
MNKQQRQNLVKAVEQAAPWEKISTSLDGVYIVKTPTHNNCQTVFIELNPSLNGQPTKRRGIYLKSSDELNKIRKICENEKLDELMNVITQYYSKKEMPIIEI